ncbi:hypothetical protein R1sor_009312 [Riccia sorocarpa]|uniref:Uncharacterized protein n=1 Tax=Riccia sorocarpa TaxID=122646 RepID=A0ABD3HWC3_9MARC
MKTENVEAGPNAPDAGIPQPRDEAGKFTIRHYVVLPDQKPGNPRIRCRYCTFEITHNITCMKHQLTGLKAASPKASTALNKRGEKNQQTCQFVPVVVREELTSLMSVQERKSGVEGEHYKACKEEPDEGDIRSSQAASPSPGFSSNPDLAEGKMEYNRALRNRSASRTPTSSLLGGPESACSLSSLEPERRMPSKNDIRYYHNMKQQHEADKKWARAVYELGLPFNIFTHKVFKEAYDFSKHLPGYVLPGPKKLSNDLLDDEFKEVKDRTEKLMFPPQGFSKMTSSKEWEKYEDGITDWTAKGKCMDTRLTIEDKNFWDEIHDLLWLIHPIWVLLRKERTGLLEALVLWRTFIIFWLGSEFFTAYIWVLHLHDMASRGQRRAGGRGNRESEDRGKRPMVDPNPIREPVEETFEEWELAPIILVQATVHPRPVDVGEGSSGGKTKRKRRNKESYHAAKARTTNNHYIRHAWFTWFAENVEHKETFRRYNTPGTSMGIQRFVEHLCELGRQTYERRRSKRRGDIAGRLATPEGKASLLTKVEMWQRWFEVGKARPVRLGSFSYKMKGCEPISDNQLRWITKPTQISKLTCRIGKGSYGSVYLVGFRDVALGKELGMEGVVSYVAKKCDAVGTNTAWVMMHKELASFVETHCAIVWPIACHNIEAEPILVYPYWNGRDIYQWTRLEHVTRGTRLPDNSGRSGNKITDHPTWIPDPEDFETLHNWKNVEIFRAHRLENHALCGFPKDRMPTWEDNLSLVFSALGDLGMAQQVHVAASDNGVKYTRIDPVERDWIAPELVDAKIRELARTSIMIRPIDEYNKATDVYALAVLTQKVCGDFFTDMTKPEWKAYNDKYYDA